MQPYCAYLSMLVPSGLLFFALTSPTRVEADRSVPTSLQLGPGTEHGAQTLALRHHFTESLLATHASTAGQPELLPAASSAVAVKETALGVEYAAMSTLLGCLCVLTAQYFLVSILLVAVRTIGQLPGKGTPDDDDAEPSLLQRTLESAEMTTGLSPMLCVLFLASQMQAMYVSDGHQDPPRWIRTCMQCATVAAVAQTLLVIVPALITRAVPTVGRDVPLGGSLEGSPILEAISAAITLALGVACAGVCAGTLLMPQLLGVTGRSVAPAVSCTVNLAIQFFAVHLALALTAGYIRLRLRAASSGPGGDARSRARGSASPRSAKLYQVLKLAAHTVFFAPMLCVVFICARVRAMQVDPQHGEAQPWAQAAFYLCAYAVLAQTLLAIIVPFLPGGDARRGTTLMEGDVELTVAGYDRGISGICIALLRHVPVLLICGGVITVIVSTLQISSPVGTTPPPSPTMQCVNNLTIQFFAVYLGLWIAIGIRDATQGARGPDSMMKRATETLYAASATVQTCPMLSILFVSLRLRAQQITGNTGEPQGWAQEVMYACTFACFVQLAACLIGAMITGRTPEVDESGNTHVQKEDTPALYWALVFAQAFALIALYGGATAICVATFALTPETAGGHGALLSY